MFIPYRPRVLETPRPERPEGILHTQVDIWIRRTVQHWNGIFAAFVSQVLRYMT